MEKNILITGTPGCGKTTLIEKVAAALGERAGGFASSEIRRAHAREGFAIKTLDGKEGVLAHIDHKSAHRVGRYGVNTEDIEGIAVPAIEAAVRTGKVVVIDEIARMELFSGAFRKSVLLALNSPCPVLAAIQMRRDSFLEKIRARRDITLITLTSDNRDQLAQTLIRHFAAT